MVDQARELARRVFELFAVAYRADPSDSNFSALMARTPDGDDGASLTDVTYAVARARGFGVPSVAHLAKASAFEHRLQESQHFCDRWLTQQPTSQDGHRLAVLVACERTDLPAARASFDALQRMEADDGLLWALETVMLLVFFGGRDAALVARKALASLPPEPLAPSVAADASYQQRDARLAMAAFAQSPDLAGRRGQEVRMKYLLRSLLIEVMRSVSASLVELLRTRMLRLSADEVRVSRAGKTR
jgi:hypothetical protein